MALKKSSLIDYLWQKSSRKIWVKLLASTLAFSALFSVLALGNIGGIISNATVLGNLSVTATNLHNQLYFILPPVIVVNLIDFPLPHAVEYFFLVKRKKLLSYLLWHCVLVEICLIFSLILAGIISGCFSKLAWIDLDFGIDFLSLIYCLFGLMIIILVLDLLSLLIGKLKSGILIELFVLADNYLLSHYGWSLLLTHGLVNLPGQTINFLTEPAVYLAYLLLLLRYLSSKNFLQEVNYA